MSLNDDQKDNMRSLAKIPAEEKCDCGWYRVDECHCDDANKYAKARQQWLRFYRELNEARVEIRLATEQNERLRKGLRFYANGRHMAFADEVKFEWEDVSGEPPNWLQNNRSEHYEMIEDGTIAKMVLRGEDQDWSEHDDGEPPAIDGEARVSDSLLEDDAPTDENDLVCSHCGGDGMGKMTIGCEWCGGTGIECDPDVLATTVDSQRSEP